MGSQRNGDFRIESGSSAEEGERSPSSAQELTEVNLNGSGPTDHDQGGHLPHPYRGAVGNKSGQERRWDGREVSQSLGGRAASPQEIDRQSDLRRPPNPDVQGDGKGGGDDCCRNMPWEFRESDPEDGDISDVWDDAPEGPPSKRRKRRRGGRTRTVPFTCVIFALIVLGTTAFLLWDFLGGNGIVIPVRDEDEADGSVGIAELRDSESGDPPSAVYPQSPDFVLPDRTALCDRAAALPSPEDLHECERACMEASCCNEPPGNRLSCLPQYAVLCDAYDDVCEILLGGDVTLLPLQDRIGGGGGNNTGLSGLVKRVEHLDSPPLRLGHICSAASVQGSFEGLSACKEACAIAECCEKGSLSSCYEENISVCDQYLAICAVLKGLKPSEVPRNSEDIETRGGGTGGIGSLNAKVLSNVCSLLSLTTTVGRVSCHEMCSNHMCCFRGMSNESGVPDERRDYNNHRKLTNTPCPINECADFGSCQVLLNLSYEEEDREAGVTYSAGFVDSVCSRQTVLTSDGKAQCHGVCDPHMCCFVNESQCQAQALIKCEVFQPCLILLEP